MIDATGAIYVIGGSNYEGSTTGTTIYHEVWASTDGGARAGLRQRGYWVGTCGGTKGAPWGVLRGSMGVVRSTTGYWWGTRGASRRTSRVPRVYPRGTKGVLRGT